MKKPVVLLVCFSMFLSCTKEKQSISRQVVKKRVDSILAVKIPQVEQDANRDLEHRIVIELRVKSDSIVRMKLSGDTLNKKTH